MSNDKLHQDIYAYLILKSFVVLFGDFLNESEENCINDLEIHLKEKAKLAQEELYNRGYKHFSSQLRLCLLGSEENHLHVEVESG